MSKKPLPSTPKRAPSLGKPTHSIRAIDAEVESAISWLRAHATKETLDGMARYAIPSTGALGVSVADIRVLAKRLGRNHELALALWDTGVYEARMLTAFVDEPARVTPAQMDRWCRDFDSWGICDTLCFHLFDKTPHAWAKVGKWADRDEEFVKRAAFALLASLALHDRQTPDGPFHESLPLIEREAPDERNFVRKAVSWALRGIGKRNPALHAAAVNAARRMAASPEPAARWVGKDALRDLASPATARRLATRRAARSR
jgi:3-methyladenine DNA glycosylase AlkD